MYKFSDARMMSRSPIFALALVVIVLCRVASADAILDQSYELTSFVSQGGVGGTSAQNVAQTIRVGVSGMLTQIDFWAYGNSVGVGDLRIDIRPTEVDGSPNELNSWAFAAITIPRANFQMDPVGNPPPISPFLVSVDFSSFGLMFDSGDMFAINFTNTSVETGTVGFAILGNFGPGGSLGPYDRGQAFLRSNDLMNGNFYAWEGHSANVGPVDLGFRTYMTPVPEPSSFLAHSLLFLSLAAFRRVRIGG